MKSKKNISGYLFFLIALFSFSYTGCNREWCVTCTKIITTYSYHYSTVPPYQLISTETYKGHQQSTSCFDSRKEAEEYANEFELSGTECYCDEPYSNEE